MYDWETFQAAYQAATDEQKAVVDSPYIPNCVNTTLVARNLDTSLRPKLIRLLALLSIHAIDRQQVVSEMVRLGVTESESVLEALQACVAQYQTAPAPTAADTPADLSTEIAETEAALKAQPTIRTMADDMQKSAPPGSTTDEPVYTTTQEALLQEGRWETAADKARPDAPKQ